MKRMRGNIWDQTAGFWIGVGLIAELPFWLLINLAPSGSCEAILGKITSCPPPAWIIIAFALATYIATAYLAHRLGLGD